MKKVLLALFALISLNAFADCPGMTVSINPTQAYCFNSCDGSATATVTGGSGNYTYSFTNSSFIPVTSQSNNYAYNLCAGTYYVIIQDVTNACADTNSFVISQPQPVMAQAGNQINPSCNSGCDGSVAAIASGGNPPYAFLWTGPNGFTSTTTFISGLCPGVYVCNITDSNGCPYTLTVSITNPTPITVNTNPTQATCGMCDGSAIATATGGAGSYVFSWNTNPPQTTATATGLCPGTHSVTVTDANGCVGVGSAVISNTGMSATATNIVNDTCGQCSGGANIIVTGGTGPYTYTMDSIQNSNGVYSNLCSGVHTAMIEDNVGCTTYYTLTIGNISTGSMTSTANVIHESGYNFSNGSIDLTVTGGLPPYSFQWSNGATTEDIYSLTMGSYLVLITDSNGECNQFSFGVNQIPGYGTITGILFEDANQNCIYDVGETPVTYQWVQISNGYWAYTNWNGVYTVTLPTGNYTIQPSNPTYITSGCLTSQNVSVANGNIDTVNFSMTIPSIYNVCTYAYSNGIVPGFNGTYMIHANNNGNQVADGIISFVFPSDLTLNSAMPSPDSMNGDTLFWSYSNLAPGAWFSVTVSFYTPPTLPLGTIETACYTSTITNGVAANPSCGQGCYSRFVSGSFDPNDKTSSPAGDVFVNEDEFTYLVRFQNTGTGPAVNITITDTLTSMLNPLSFEMLNASHPYMVEFINGNIIKWRFENIMLPDSGSNEPGSHGHVQFRLNTQNTPVVGQVIENRANIYFDFNEPVITNTAINTFVAPNGVEELSNGTFSIYPNPAENVLYVQSEKGNANYTIYDVTGKVNVTHNTISANSSLDISSLSSGVYFIRYISGEEVSTIKFIKK